MKSARKGSLRFRILSIGIALPAMLVAVLFVLYARSARTEAEQSYVDKARSIGLTVESARDEMEQKWENGLFTNE